MIDVKPGVTFVLAPAGVRILEALKAAASTLNLALTITSGSDGEHSGPSDPHHSGEAYDVRTHDFTDGEKTALLREVMRHLQRGDMDAPLEVAGGLATMHFFAFLEAAGTPNEHLHVQRRRGTTYSMEDFLAA